MNKYDCFDKDVNNYIECYAATEVKAKLKELLEDIHWLLDYNRRVAQRQVVENDLKSLEAIRADIKTTKEIIND